MGVAFNRALRIASLCALSLAAISLSTFADEIRLKDGKKLYGVIEAYEGNMFKVKTDFGYVLVEKDKIAFIFPNVTPSHNQNAAKTGHSTADKPVQTKAPVTPVSEAVPEKKTVPISFSGSTTPIVPPTKA